MEKVGIIGCGLMGRGIALNLLKNGYEVYVHDVNNEAVKDLEREGAIAADHIGTMEKVKYLILSLPFPSLIKSIILDENNGAIRVMKSGSYILDMSTNDVEITKELNEHAKLKNIEFFDCPLSGGPAGAADGTLTIMVGGNEKAFPKITPLLKAVGEQIEYVGSSGAGQTVKLCHNMVVGGVITLLSEAFLTGEKAGVSKDKLASILQKGSAQTKVMDVFGSNILDDTFNNIKFSLANMTKDIHLYRNLAEKGQIPTFTSQSIYQLFKIANHKGKGAQDATAVYDLIAEQGESFAAE